jgi:hypothetical protein
MSQTDLANTEVQDLYYTYDARNTKLDHETPKHPCCSTSVSYTRPTPPNGMQPPSFCETALKMAVSIGCDSKEDREHFKKFIPHYSVTALTISGTWEGVRDVTLRFLFLRWVGNLYHSLACLVPA